LETAPCFSVIVPVYSNLAGLDRCLDSLRQSELRHRSEIIVVDDCSPESRESVEQVASRYGARYHRQAENAGPGIARNCGASFARGDILVFIDSDCVAPTGWMSRLTQPIREGKCDVTTSCYSSPVSEKWITTFQNEDYLYRMPSTECETYFINSCNLAIKRDLFLDCGGFPKQRVSEDLVLGMLLAKNGTPARYMPEAGVQHGFCGNLTSYLRQRFSFCTNAVPSYLDRSSWQSANADSKVRSHNPVRTALGAFFSMLAVMSLVLAGVTAILTKDLVATALSGSLVAIALESAVHGRFLLFLRKHCGLARSISYIPLLHMVDLAYALGILVGVARGMHKACQELAFAAGSH
jgi:glycosyltransferase involved in cell wall biosynthesis